MGPGTSPASGSGHIASSPIRATLAAIRSGERTFPLVRPAVGTLELYRRSPAVGTPRYAQARMGRW